MKTLRVMFVPGLALAAAVSMLVAGCDGMQDARQKLSLMDTAMPTVSDRDLSLRIMSALANDAVLKDYRITVVTLKGDVRLVGVVDTQAQVRHAADVASAVEGAENIHDELGIWQ